MIKKTLKKRLHNKENKVILCAGIAPMATYEADCWSGVCYSSSCYSMGCWVHKFTWLSRTLPIKI